MRYRPQEKQDLGRKKKEGKVDAYKICRYVRGALDIEQSSGCKPRC